MKMDKGVKELLEVVAGMKTLAIAGKKVFADGKVNGADLGVVLALMADKTVIQDAVEGASEAVVEAKDLTLDEVMVIIAAVVQAAKDLKAA
jgi:hypothetical protein